jgi:DNA-binding NarL/FixJ family response regulator
MNRDQAIAIVFDDHQLFADSFSSLIERMDVFRSVHAFSDERVLIQYLIKHSGTPLCLFLDFYLQDKNALPLINEIKRLNKRSVIIVVSSVTNPIAVANILDYTPNGLISKSSGFDTILSCLQAIGQGEQFVCPVLRAGLRITTYCSVPGSWKYSNAVQTECPSRKSLTTCHSVRTPL